MTELNELRTVIYICIHKFVMRLQGTKMLCERHIVWRLRDTETFVLAAHCMEIVGHMDVYASGALYGDCGGTMAFVLAAHM